MITDHLRWREDAKAIWWAGVQAVQPRRCLGDRFQGLGVPVESLAEFDRILVVGGGKAGAAMAEALESLLETHGVPLDKVAGLVNVPNESVVPLKRIRLHPARPMGINQPTEAACAGTAEILKLAESAGPNDVMICLLSGGGSALLPAPVPGISLADKQHVTKLLHECGATIQEMNAVRKHLSLIKGGGLVRHFRGARIFSLIISDVIGDPLDVIASGPTAVDPTTFADALQVLENHDLLPAAPDGVVEHLRRGVAGHEPETLKSVPIGREGKLVVANLILANNQQALVRASVRAAELGYWTAGFPFGFDIDQLAAIQGDTGRAAIETTSTVRRIANRTDERTRQLGVHPICLFSGGETTVVLPPGHGLGGRNQEYVLTFLHKLGADRMKGITVLSGGTDGEDGPTDAAGAIGDAELLAAAAARGLDPAAYLTRHDAYHFFEPLGGLFKTGLTQTNVMDLRVILVHPE